MEEKKEQLEFLNTLRFLSVIWIVFAHFNYQCFSHYSTENILETFCYNNSSWLYWIFYGITGKYAVAMMCVVSGFLVAKKFYKKSVDFGKFIFNRYIRLMLPVFFACTVYIIIKKILGTDISLSKYLNGVFWLGNSGINEHLGYILDFFLSNIFIAMITYMFSNKKNFPIIYIPLIVLLYYMEKIWIVSGVIGGLTYHLCEYIKNKKIYKYWYIILLLPVIWYLPRGEEGNKIYLRDTIACSLIIITLYCLPKLQQVFKWNKLQKVKKISYSLFVVHGLVNNLISGNIVQYIQNCNIVNNIFVLQLITFLIVLIIDIVIASILYYTVEYKIYNWLKTYLNKKENNYKIELIK